MRERAITTWPAQKLNFWNISKSAGTSVKNSLLRKNGVTENISNEGIHHDEHITYISETVALNNGCKNIAVIRDPCQRVLSLFRDFSLKRKRTIPVYNRTVDINRIQDLDYFIEVYIVNGSDHDNLHLKSISWHLCNNDKKILVDEIYNINNVDRLFEKYHIEKIHRNTTISNTVLDQTHIDAIRYRYADDYSIFKDFL